MRPLFEENSALALERVKPFVRLTELVQLRCLARTFDKTVAALLLEQREITSAPILIHHEPGLLCSGGLVGDDVRSRTDTFVERLVHEDVTSLHLYNPLLSTVRRALQRCAHLRELRLEDVEPNTIFFLNGWMSFQANCMQSLFLAFVQFPSPDPYSFDLCGPNLVKLTLSNVSLQCLPRICAGCPMLESLSFMPDSPALPYKIAVAEVDWAQFQFSFDMEETRKHQYQNSIEIIKSRMNINISVSTPIFALEYPLSEFF